MPVAPLGKLGPYEVKSLLGRGGMGEVYRGWDARLGRDVAIKVLPAVYSEDPDRLRRFGQEARAAAALNHPNIVAVFDIGTEGGSPYVVSELLEGQTLREAMGAGRLPLRKALDFAIQIATGLAAAHEKGIVHRDIKPENVFVGNDGHVKILDFGLAKLRETSPSGAFETVTIADGSHSTAGMVMGTAGYMSPEQVRGDPVDHRTDIFSFGATLYEVVSGARAFKGDSAIETLHAILNDDPPDLTAGERTRPEVARVIQHCLEKEPSQRFQSARDLTFALKQLTGTASSSAIASPAFARSRRFPWIAAGLLLATVALGGTFLAGTRATVTTADAAPSFRQLTFRRGAVEKARFAPDGQTVISAASWDGEPLSLQSTRIDTRASTALGLGDAQLESVSRSGELAVVVKGSTLARVPIGLGGMREVLEGVKCADWAPDGTMAAVRIGGRREWLEYPLGHSIFEDPLNFHSCMRVSPDGQFIAMIQQEKRQDAKEWVTIVDRDGRVRSQSQKRPMIVQDGLAWTPDSREVWFGGAAGDVPFESAIRAMTLAGEERVVHRTIGSIRIEDIAPDGRALVASDFNRTELRVVDTRTRTERDLTWLGHTAPKGLSSDGRQVIFSEITAGAGGKAGAFIRPTDGGPAVQLGDGVPMALSPDGKWVLLVEGESTKLRLVPTGAGEGRPLDVGPLEATSSQANWTPDGQRVVLLGNVAGKRLQMFSLPVSGGAPTPVTPEGVRNVRPIVSPDSSTILGVDLNGALWRYPINGNGSPVTLAGHIRGDVPLAWSPDNASVWVMAGVNYSTGENRGQSPGQIFRIDLATGRRTFWYDVPLSDAASTTARSLNLHLSADGRTFVYSYSQHLSDLYLAEGLR